MITFIAITAVLSLIGLTCLKKFNWGLIPVVITSAVIAGVICVVVNVTTYKVVGPDKVWIDTVLVKSDKPFEIRKGSIKGLDVNLDDIDKLIVDTIKYPVLARIKYHEEKDMNLFWNIGFNKTVKRILILNKRDYEIFKAYKSNAK